MKVLLVLTSHDQLGDTGMKTGFWLEEFAAPYYVFKDQGADITLATPKGGLPPLDPTSDGEDFQTDATRRYAGDKDAQQHLATTVKLDTINSADYDAVFYPGGHGPLWDLSENEKSKEIIESQFNAGKPVGLVCHAVAALRHTKLSNGDALVKGKRVTGFSNAEEAAVQLTDVVPFLVEDNLIENGGLYNKGDDWVSYIETDANLITGQNPASSEAVAVAMLAQLNA
jgi:putative intracellular protease/amidase